MFDADTPEAVAALYRLEEECECPPPMRVRTTRGEHHYYRRAPNTIAKSDAHNSDDYPERIDIKTGRALVILPPSTGKHLIPGSATHRNELGEVGQKFIAAVYAHNGREAPRLPATKAPAPKKFPSTSAVRIRQIRALLEQFDPDSGYGNWLSVLMAVHHETGGSEIGFELVDAWSSRGSKYRGEEELRTKWLSFRDDVATPYTFNTLCRLVEDAGVDWIQVLSDLEPEFEPCPYTVIDPTTAEATDDPSVPPKPASEHPLVKFSLKGISAAIRKEAGDQVPLLGHIALMGQATALYAAPNTGKTLLVLFLLIEAIKNDRINPACFFYINMDDTLTGLSEKLEFAEKYGFHMLADGYQGFTPPRLVELLLELIASEHARGTVIVLDTLKKVTNLMDKTQSSNFQNS